MYLGPFLPKLKHAYEYKMLVLWRIQEVYEVLALLHLYQKDCYTHKYILPFNK